LTKLGIRYYDPTLGRFTQVDPTGQDPHYTYAGNSPISYIDPSGAGFRDAIEFTAAVTSYVALGAAVAASAPVAVVGLAAVGAAASTYYFADQIQELPDTSGTYCDDRGYCVQRY